jgi:hypothetical protein
LDLAEWLNWTARASLDVTSSGVAGGMLLYPLLGDVATFALYGGAFIGMSAPSRLYVPS